MDKRELCETILEKMHADNADIFDFVEWLEGLLLEERYNVEEENFEEE